MRRSRFNEMHRRRLRRIRRERAFLAQLASGATWVGAAHGARLAPHTVYRWRRQDAMFDYRCTLALAVARDERLANALARRRGHQAVRCEQRLKEIAFLRAVASGWRLTAAARVTGHDPSTVVRWRRRDPMFDYRCSLALAVAFDARFSKMMTAPEFFATRGVDDVARQKAVLVKLLEEGRPIGECIRAAELRESTAYRWRRTDADVGVAWRSPRRKEIIRAARMEKEGAFLRAVARGQRAHVAAVFAGVHYSTVKRWREQDVMFRARWLEAEAVRSDRNRSRIAAMQPGTSGQWIRKCRQLAGLSLRDLAKITGFSTAGLGKMELGTRPLGDEMAMAVIHALGVEKLEGVPATTRFGRSIRAHARAGCATARPRPWRGRTEELELLEGGVL